MAKNEAAPDYCLLDSVIGLCVAGRIRYRDLRDVGPVQSRWMVSERGAEDMIYAILVVVCVIRFWEE